MESQDNNKSENKYKYIIQGLVIIVVGVLLVLLIFKNPDNNILYVGIGALISFITGLNINIKNS